MPTARCLTAVIGSILLTPCAWSQAVAGSETVIHAFQGSDGSYPLSTLLNVNGVLYGTTASGGSASPSGGCGTVFSVSPTQAEALVYAFKCGADGNFPSGALVNLNGTLYGTTQFGGLAGIGSGSVFSVTPAGIENIIFSFYEPNGGQNPEAGVINVGGTLYGTAPAGGDPIRKTANCGNGCGTVFSVTPAGDGTVVYAFKGSTIRGGGDGARPLGGLTAVGGTIYGTTAAGGNGDGIPGGRGARCGTVFTITPSGSETVVYSFQGNLKGVGLNAAGPQASTVAVGNILYGTAFGGYGGAGSNGVIYSIATGGVEKIVHLFKGSPRDGAAPYAELLNLNGTLYGTTSLGGVNGQGSVFSVTPSGVEKVVYSFKGGADGAKPFTGLINIGDVLYGTTTAGGGTGCGGSGCGTVFSVTP